MPATRPGLHRFDVPDWAGLTSGTGPEKSGVRVLERLVSITA